MPAQIDRRRSGVALLALAQQKGDGGGARRVALERLGDGGAQRRSSILVEKLEQQAGLMAGRFAAGEGSIEQVLALRRGRFEASGGHRACGLTLEQKQRLLMAGIENELLRVVAAAVRGHD